MELKVKCKSSGVDVWSGVCDYTVTPSIHIHVYGKYNNGHEYNSIIPWSRMADPQDVLNQLKLIKSNDIYVEETGFPGGRTYEGVTSCTVVEGKYISLMANVDSNFSYGVRLEWDTMKDPQSVINQLKNKGIPGSCDIDFHGTHEPRISKIGDTWFTGHGVWRKEA